MTSHRQVERKLKVNCFVSGVTFMKQLIFPLVCDKKWQLDEQVRVVDVGLWHFERVGICKL